MVIAVGTAGCDAGTGLDPGAGNALGTGSHTLAVTGSAYAVPRQGDARFARDFTVAFAVVVARDGQAVATGAVSVTSATGKVALTYSAADQRWTGSADRYDEVYALDIASGSDQVAGVRVDGPDIHVFSQPVEDATVDAAAPIAISWDRDQPADATAMWAEAFDWFEVSDTGSYALAAGALRLDKTQIREHTLRLARSNTVAPAGATPGSRWTVAIENDVHVVTPPMPL
jgi:hypothetical protein